ncbi:hypothetical protein GGF46_001254 [Coemansia sp. RSA 552]|nr:hypothetical protein GGF46_001254 [Coemansia sp. RSA 552]
MRISVSSIGLATVFSSLVLARPIVKREECKQNIQLQISNLLLNDDIWSNAEQCEKDSSGEGYAAGLAWFTTTGSDVYEIAKEYKNNSDNTGELDEYIDVLAKYAEEESGSTEGLDGFCDAWKKAADNGAFWDAQLKIENKVYWFPSTDLMDQVGLNLGLSQTVIFDSSIIFGFGEDGVNGLIDATNKKFKKNVSGSSGSTLTVGKFKVDEIKWLKAFLDAREDLGNSDDEHSIENFRYIIKQGNYDLEEGTKMKDLEGKTVTLKCP